MEQTQETAPEAEAQGLRTFGFVFKRGIIQRKLRKGIFEVAVLITVDRIKTAINHRVNLAIAWQRCGARLARGGDGFAREHVLDVLDLGGQVADFAAIKFFGRDFFRGTDADFRDLIDLIDGHQKNLVAHFDMTFFNANKKNDATIGIVVTVEDQGF